MPTDYPLHKSQPETGECDCDQTLKLKRENKHLRKEVRRLNFALLKICKDASEAGDA